MAQLMVEDPHGLARAWTSWFERWRCECRTTSWPLALRGAATVDHQLASFLGWWRTNEDVPAKLPNALQVRTAVYLTVRSIETGDDLTGGLLS